MIYFNLMVSRFSLTERRRKKYLLKKLIENHGKKMGEISYIFLSDDGLLEVNRNYLNHNTFTDIITFDNSEAVDLIEGDIFISIDRIKENAQKFNVTFEHELIRVMSHGILHLLGYKDKSAKDTKEMRAAEEKAISMYFNPNS